VHPSDCATSKFRPAIFNVPVRGGPAVGATLKVTGPDPLPLAPEAIVIQSTVDVEAHVQSGLDDRTSTLPVPPACGNDADALLSVMTHSPAACVNCARTPLTTTAPVRVIGSTFAAALT
jgi:hypothetical protein